MYDANRCNLLIVWLLGVKTEGLDDDESRQEYLNFPLNVGRSWTSKVSQQRAKSKNTRWVDLNYKALAWEKVQTDKAELDAFKIEVSGWEGGQVRTYYYSPKVKAIVRFELKGPNQERRVTLVDFSASE